MRVFYAVKYYYERRLAFYVCFVKNSVKLGVRKIARVPDTALMRRSVRRLVERRARYEPDRDARFFCVVENAVNAVVVRSARQNIYTVEAAAALKPFENGVFAEDLYALSFFAAISASRFFFTSSPLPHDFSPSGHAPRKQPGPQFLNRLGATLRTSPSMSQATSRISHCARLQQRSEKKCISSRAFMVTTS